VQIIAQKSPKLFLQKTGEHFPILNIVGGGIETTLDAILLKKWQSPKKRLENLYKTFFVVAA
jgi:hypothetical protein